MKLVRFGPPGEEKPGVWLEDKSAILDVRGTAFDIQDYDGHFFTHHGLRRLHNLLAEPRPKLIPAKGVRLGPPLACPGTIVCLGKNYLDHAKEFDNRIPTQPILFSKATSSIVGPFDPILLPKDSRVVDGEVELAVVIGRTTRRVSESEAMSCIAGYTVLNDVTDREAQRAAGQWFRAKSFDTFCPMGPFFVTPDEIPDPQALKLYSKVNGETLQESNTSDMIFKIPQLISFISATITLRAGDVIATGTPGGIGSVHQPPVLLKAGDTVETGIERVGVQVNPVRSD